MNINDFDFELPTELIAKYPLAERTASRLLVVTGNVRQHLRFKNILELINSEDLLVFNNTRVIQARLYGEKETGGKLECLVERVLTEQTALVHLKSSKSPKPGAKLLFEKHIPVEVLGRQGALFELKFDTAKTVLGWLEDYGHMPLPPYVDRPDENSDKTRYQTVYAKHDGAVAAPTAGLHFDETLLKALKLKGVSMAEVTLHVGAGTFQPVRVDDVKNHHMHSEWMVLDDTVAEAVKACKARGGRVVAVGTTSVRCLETAAKSGEIQSYQGDTDIFIYPGFKYQVVDALITNFHLPKSTLMMLVSALAGRDIMMAAYTEAVKQGYRFFSYGDAMFIC